MGHYFDSGFFVREPAWHQLGNVLPDWPGTFEEARQLSGLTWDVKTSPVFVPDTDAEGNVKFNPSYTEVDGWQLLRRDDTDAVLSIQKDSYAVIGNGEFGNIIDYVMNGHIQGTANLKFETLISLHGGKQIIATMYLDEPITLPNDPSETYPYMVFISRHDGLGGMKLGPTAVRVVCANTQAIAEKQMDRHGFAFTIRHTNNWADRIEQARVAVASNMGAFKSWEVMASDLAKFVVTDAKVEDFLDKWLPYSTNMSDQQRNNMTTRRNQFKAVYNGPTCEGIAGTKWGVLQAAVELVDHYQPAHSLDTRIGRTLTRVDPNKALALEIVGKL
ncbi:LGT_TIGR03299, phage/plasmid-like protein TIGR03299 [uncultured Caudovirales phage]|uniref:LGT_TIGR03299, phage/plasmid-like protein TIGR03299 n=1 Tax=uncultured Caudovirales phage TaxID=2100421 RepID=A0A6J5RLU8_9CAUD|nr:LGT_TIGR03299, phage/plasmid-like protein TIGR03299 [uncultured Caudovirales phage]